MWRRARRRRRRRRTWRRGLSRAPTFFRSACHALLLRQPATERAALQVPGLQQYGVSRCRECEAARCSARARAMPTPCFCTSVLASVRCTAALLFATMHICERRCVLPAQLAIRPRQRHVASLPQTPQPSHTFTLSDSSSDDGVPQVRVRRVRLQDRRQVRGAWQSDGALASCQLTFALRAQCGESCDCARCNEACKARPALSRRRCGARCFSLATLTRPAPTAAF